MSKGVYTQGCVSFVKGHLCPGVNHGHPGQSARRKSGT